MLSNLCLMAAGSVSGSVRKRDTPASVSRITGRVCRWRCVRPSSNPSDKGEEGSTRRFGGTGLGLAIVKEFLELQRGTIRVTDAPGGGAFFEVRLPLFAPPGTRVHAPAEAGMPEESFQQIGRASCREGGEDAVGGGTGD